MLSKRELKWVNALKNKKYRLMERAYLAEGPRLVRDLLASGQRPLKIFLAGSNPLPGLPPGFQVNDVTDAELRQLSGMQNPQEVVAVFAMPDLPPPGPHPEGQWGVALEFVQDPGNLGTIIRTLDWLGFGSLYCSEGSAEAYNPKVVQAAMGSTARVAVHYVDLPAFLRSSGAPAYAATAAGVPVAAFNGPPGILVFGNEGAGISAEVEALCTGAVSIPRLGGGESLNLAMSVGMLTALLRFR